MVIQITEEKIEGLVEQAEKVLKHAGKMMQCLESMKDEDCEYGERYHSYREDNERDYDHEMGMRRGYPRSGRYGRY